MQNFSSEEKALEYAQEEIGKYEYEVAEVDGIKTILCSTGLPIEDLIRNKVEEIFAELYRTVGVNPETTDAQDRIMFLGAQTTDYILENIKEKLGIDVLSAYLDY